MRHATLALAAWRGCAQAARHSTHTYPHTRAHAHTCPHTRAHAHTRTHARAASLGGRRREPYGDHRQGRGRSLPVRAAAPARAAALLHGAAVRAGRGGAHRPPLARAAAVPPVRPPHRRVGVRRAIPRYCPLCTLHAPILAPASRAPCAAACAAVRVGVRAAAACGCLRCAAAASGKPGPRLR
jgi:hypothetical protein